VNFGVLFVVLRIPPRRFSADWMTERKAVAWPFKEGPWHLGTKRGRRGVASFQLNRDKGYMRTARAAWGGREVWR
jgi:hypothetical protein